MKIQMKINSSMIIELRRQRAWSQQQLADIACISLRTIQRIESSKKASQESIKAIAAAFDITVNHLLEPDTSSKQSRKLKLAGGILLAFSFAASLFIMTNVNAESLMIKLQVTSDDKTTNVQLVHDSGQKGKVIIDDEFKLEITPTIIHDNKVSIKTRIFETNESGDFELISSPTVITDNRTKATIRLDTPKQAHYTIILTPHL